jgi:hypothetical protein
MSPIRKAPWRTRTHGPHSQATVVVLNGNVLLKRTEASGLGLYTAFDRVTKGTTKIFHF